MPIQSATSRYLLRYWLFIIYAIGVPGFVKFDATGNTHDFGVFNRQSIADIALTLSCLALFFYLTAISRRNVSLRPVRFGRTPWLLLLGLLVVTSLASPNDNVSISVYRMCEWVLGYILLVSAYSGAPFLEAPHVAREMIAAICWACLAIVWLALPFFPSLAFSVPVESTGVVQFRLGGYLIHPNGLGVVAGIAFWHAFLFRRSVTRIALCSVALVSLLLTYSRGAWAGFALSIIAYVVVSRRSRVRIMGVVGLITGIATFLVFSGPVVRLLERGEGQQNLRTLSDRALVWSAAVKAISARPLLGYGYIDGVKHVLPQFTSVSYWSPMHCHNELLQALASGGTLAGLLVLWVYIVGFLNSYRSAKSTLSGGFMFLSVIQLIVFATLTPLLMKPYSQLGAILLICLVASSDARKVSAEYSVYMYQQALPVAS